MRSSELRERVTIFRQGQTIGNLGEPSPVWSTVGTIWAGVVPLKSWEVYRRGTTVPTSVVRILMRSGVDIRESDRLLWGGKYYEVYSIARSPKRDAVEVLAIWTA